jgi:hypothetical protein
MKKNNCEVKRKLEYCKKTLYCVTVVLLCTLAGCLRSDSGPLDNENLRLMTVSAKNGPCLSKPDENLQFDITEEQASALVAVF